MTTEQPAYVVLREKRQGKVRNDCSDRWVSCIHVSAAASAAIYKSSLPAEAIHVWQVRPKGSASLPEGLARSPKHMACKHVHGVYGLGALVGRGPVRLMPVVLWIGLKPAVLLSHAGLLNGSNTVQDLLAAR